LESPSWKEEGPVTAQIKWKSPQPGEGGTRGR
jgi:hypothetical protein